MKYPGRLMAGTVAVLLLTVILLVVLAERSLRGELVRDLEANLVRQGVLIRETLPEDSTAWPGLVRRLGSAGGFRITLIDRAGRVRADTEVPPEDDLLSVSIPGTPDGGTLRIALPLGQVNRTVRRAQRTVLVAALLALLPGCLVAWLAGRAVARPITETAGTARAIAEGRKPRFPHSRIPEIESMVGALRRMHEELESRFGTLERKQHEIETLVNAMVEGVISCDRSGRVVVANPAARHLLGYGPERELPALPVLFRHKLAREAVAAALAGATVPDREVDLDGRTCLVSARPLPGGGAVVVLHDLTELRKLEAIRKDFVANVSHELKTPLTSIAGYAETLLGDRTDEATARHFLETILQNARRMQELVDDQLDLSRIESGHWRPAPARVGLADALREPWEALETGSPSGLSFAARVEPDAAELLVDPEAFRQVLANLYDNARRHTSPGGRVTVRSAREGNGVLVTVRDSGTGIAGEHLPRIFERFYRADPSRSRARGGTGLGLAIVKHLVEAHGGRVWAQSSLGEGTTIACWFPAGAATA